MNVKQCEFSIGFDGEIEEISMSTTKNHLSKRMIRNMLIDCVNDGSLLIGQRCEGKVFYRDKENKIIINSKRCVGIGGDWNDDKWVNNFEIDFPTDRIDIHERV